MTDAKCILVGMVVTLIAYLFNVYFQRVYNYWRNRGIPCVEGAIPIFGNTFTVFTFRQNFVDFCQNIYQKYHNRSMIGFYQFRQPSLLLRDPELVKTVLISGFSNFHENVLTVNPKLDPLLALNPFFTAGEEWKIQRSRLSNALMSSKKLKVLCYAVTNVCHKFKKYLEDSVKKSNGVYEVETKDLFSRFTGEVVASTGFGVEGDFFSNGSGRNSFKEHVQGIFDPTFVNAIRQSILFFIPVINILLRISFLPKHVEVFFRRIVNEMLSIRRKDGIVRNDFLQLMLDAQKSETSDIDELAVTASATSFFLDGYETSSVTLGFFAYQVASNPHVQEEMRREVNAVLEKYDGEIKYEALSEMTYMEQALNESMRLYPALGFIIKRCSQQCKLVGNDGIECLVEPGTEIIVPIQALQTDPQYWENAQIYDPERFSPEKKNLRPKTVYIPFGEGPRICVGMRFGIMQIKAAMATMLRYYTLELSSKTRLPLKLKRTAFLAAVEGGIWIKLKPL